MREPDEEGGGGEECGGSSSDDTRRDYLRNVLGVVVVDTRHWIATLNYARALPCRIKETSALGVT